MKNNLLLWFTIEVITLIVVVLGLIFIDLSSFSLVMVGAIIVTVLFSMMDILNIYLDKSIADLDKELEIEEDKFARFYDQELVITKLTDEEFNKYIRQVQVRIDIQKQWRLGQTYFNVLLEMHPELAEMIRGTSIDPFHFDGSDNIVIQEFLDSIH